MTRSHRLALCLAFCGSAFLPTSLVAQTQLSVSGVAAPAAVAVVGGSIATVTIAAGPGSATDWIALYPTGAADGAYLDWRYLSGTTAPPAAGLTDATLNRLMPVTAGTYEFRLFANDGFSRLATSGVITVSESPAALLVNGVASATIAAGTTAAVAISDGPGSPTDWIALYPTGAADSAYLDWRYLNGATVAPGTGLTDATVSFNTPITPGSYEFRLFASDSFARLATRVVTVVASAAELMVNGVSPPTAAAVSAGTIMTVEVNKGPANPGDWVAFYTVGAPDGTPRAWKYLNDSTTQPAVGSVTSMLTFQAPSASGSYEFRFFPSNSFARLATSTTVLVSTSAAQLVVNGIAPPTAVTVAAGSVAVVTVSDGPANAGDWVAFAPVGAPASAYVDWRYLNGTTVAPAPGLSSATLTFAMPSTAGTYEFRFFANNTFDQVAVSSPVTVSAPIAQIAVNAITPPSSVTVAPESTVTIQISGGPGNTTDWVALADVSASNSSSIAWMYLNGTMGAPATGLTSGTVTMTLPASPGNYEIRFFANNGFSRLATSSTISTSSSPAVVTVQLTSPFPGTFFNQPTSLTLEATATISTGTIARVDFLAGATVIGTATTAPYQAVWNAPPAGSHTLTAVVTDHANVVTASDPVYIGINESTDGFGSLAGPIVSPPSGFYGPGLAVTLTAAAGATIRFTTDGSFVDETSPVYSGPITVNADTHLRASAFQTGWYQGNVKVHYEIDHEPPTIHAIPSPLPNSTGWNTTNSVTVNFVCFDRGGVGSCPSPMTIAQEGITEVVSGTAIDIYGHQSTTSVTVKIDSIGPTVSLSAAPENHSSVSASTVSIAGSATDVLSELGGVKCNGVPATVTNGAVACDVPLTPGLNSVVVSAMDAAGNPFSLGRAVVRQGTPTTLTISPDTRTLLVGETGALTATSEFGPVHSGVTWESSDNAIASVSDTGRVTVTGHAVGDVTITAGLSLSLSATAAIRVIAPESAEASTAVRWTVPSVPGFAARRPIFANRIDDDGPDLFDINTAYSGGGPPTTVVRGLRYDGTQVWSATVQGVPAFGDVFGGLVVKDDASASLTRLGGPSDAFPWRYESVGSLLDKPAQADDGTIYQVEVVESSVLSSTGRPTYQGFVIGLDGRTGALKFREMLPASSSYRDLGSSPDHHIGVPYASAPVIGLDGEAYVAFLESHDDWRAHEYHLPYEQCGIAPLYFDECPPWETHDASGLGTFSRSSFLKLMKVASGGGATIQTLWESSTGGEDSPGRVYSENMASDLGGLTIDEDGAVLIQTGRYAMRWVMDSVAEINDEDQCPRSQQFDGWCYHIAEDETTRQLTRVSDGSLSTRALPPDDGSTYMGSNTLTLVGDDHTAFLQYASTIEAIDTRTLNTKWTVASDCCETLTPIRDGGVAIGGFDGSMRAIDATGTVTTLGAMSGDSLSQTAFGVWTGLSIVEAPPGYQLSARFGPPLDEAPFSYFADGGNAQRQNAQRYVDTELDRAALRGLDSVYTMTIATGWEWGGRICRQGSKFLLSRFVTGVVNAVGVRIDINNKPTDSGRPDAVAVEQQTQCQPQETTVGMFHTHVPNGGSPGPSTNDLDHASFNPEWVFFMKPASAPVLRFQAQSSNPNRVVVDQRSESAWHPAIIYLRGSDGIWRPE